MRRISVCYVNAEPKAISARMLNFEKYLSQLGSVEVQDRETMEAAYAESPDIVIYDALLLDSSGLLGLVKSLYKNVVQSEKIWTPVLIYVRAEFGLVKELLPFANQVNWYFDLVTEEHLEILPIRVGNLVRIHDHLKEMFAYKSEIATLESRLEEVEAQLNGK